MWECKKVEATTTLIAMPVIWERSLVPGDPAEEFTQKYIEKYTMSLCQV